MAATKRRATARFVLSQPVVVNQPPTMKFGPNTLYIGGRRMRIHPSFFATLSAGSTIGAASTVPRRRAAPICANGISTKRTLDESPPVWSVQALIATTLMSFNDDVATVLPSKSFPLRIGESALTQSEPSS